VEGRREPAPSWLRQPLTNGYRIPTPDPTR
jgi:hypothetical protein